MYTNWTTKIPFALLLLIASLFIFVTSITLAQTLPDSSTSSAVRKPEKAVGLTNAVNRIVDHLEKVVDRSERVLDRLQTRVIRSKSAGKDTKEMERLINESRARLTKVTSSLNDINTLNATATTKTEFQRVREKIKVAKEDLQQVHKNIVVVIGLLRGGNSSVQDSTSSSALRP